MLEIPLQSRTGFIYMLEGLTLEDFARLVSIRHLSTEHCGGMDIATVEVLEDFIFLEDPERLAPSEIKCMHSCTISHESANILPQDGWEELIDCWSCHNCEFKTMLELVPRPRKHGVLLSDFFLLINDADLPGCCQNGDFSSRKLFYNEIELCGYPHSRVIYMHLNAYFRGRNMLLLVVDDVNYEIRYFYSVMLVNAADGAAMKKEALKVGIRRTTRIVEPSGSINRFYAERIHSAIVSNAVGTSILGYQISFVIKE